MDLTKAKSEGYLWGNGTGTTASDKKKLLAVIGVYTGFGSRLKRNTFRGSWMPRGLLVLVLLVYSFECKHKPVPDNTEKT
jgi:hypothetical protein